MTEEIVNTEVKGMSPAAAVAAKIAEPVKTDVKATSETQDKTLPVEPKVTPTPKTYKVKVDGKETEVTEDELIRGYAHATAANRKFQEAALTRKQAEEFVSLLKTDPIKLLKDPRLGHNLRKLAEEYLVEEMQKEMMTPEQKELYESKEKLRAYEDQKKADEKAKEEAQFEELKAKYSEEISKDIVKALDSSGLPKTEHTVKRMAYYMREALVRGYELKAVDVVELVRADFKLEAKTLLDQLDGDSLIEFLGENAAKKIAEFNLAKIKSVGKKVPASEQGKNEHEETTKTRKLSKEEWRKKLEAI